MESLLKKLYTKKLFFGKYINFKHCYNIIKKWSVHNIFTTFLQQILSDRLLLVVIVGGEKVILILGSNLN